METIYALFQHFFLSFSLLFLVFTILFYKCVSANRSSGKNLPPSPPKLPIIGNLHQLGLTPQRSLRLLSNRYGKLMMVYMGSKPAVVVTSADGAKEVMKTHDSIFCNRPVLRNPSRLFYDRKDVALAPYGEYMRQMKSILVTQLLSNKKVESFRTIREEEVAIMVDKIINESSSSPAVNLTDIIRQYTYDVICRASFEKKYTRYEKGISFMDCLDEAIKLLAQFFVGDFIPSLSWIDRINGREGRLEKTAQQLDKFLDEVIEEHQIHLSAHKNRCAHAEKSNNSFVDILLEENIPLQSVKANILEMFAAGNDTIYTLIEWVIIELIRHPKAMKELQKEVRKSVGVTGRRVREEDLEKLTYLKAVVKETLRLHPPAPLLIFREAMQDAKINGFDIAKGTIVIINAWAIQRDSKYWEEPEEFRPERFMLDNRSVDLKGRDFQFIPFGAGRRGCPGASFAIVNAELVIATLISEFDLKLPDGILSETLDMTEIAALAVRRRDPLIVVATHAFCLGKKL